MTYAQALASSTTPSGAMINIEINTPTENMRNEIYNNIQNAFHDASKHEEKILGISKSGMKIKCKDNTVANTITDKLKEKLQEKIKITSLTPRKPRLKIVGLNTNNINALELAEQLKIQNPCIADESFQVLSVYSVKSPHGTYNNAIIECDLSLHSALINQQTLKLELRTQKSTHL